MNHKINLLAKTDKLLKNFPKGNSQQTIPGDISNHREKITRNCPAGNSSAQTLDMKEKALQIFFLICILLRSHEAEKRCGNNRCRTPSAEFA